MLSYDSRVNEYGNETGQGLKTDMVNLSLRTWYVINPAYNLAIQAGVRIRNTDNFKGPFNTTYYYLGISTHLTNSYFDF